MRRLFEQILPVQAFRREDRRISAVMWVAGVFQGFAQAQVTNTLPFVRLSLGITEGEMSSLLAIARLGAFLAFAFTLRGDRSGRRGPFLLAFAILMVANAATALVYQPTVFAVLQALVRMGTTAVGVLAIVLLSEHLSPPVRAYGLAIYGAAGSFGAGLAVLLLPLAQLGAESWRLLFAASGIGLLLLPFLARHVGESPIHDPFDGGSFGLFAPLVGGNRGRFFVLGTISFLSAAFTTVAISFSFERLINDVGLSVGAAVAISLIGGTLGGLGFFVGGRMADELGRRPATTIGFLLAVAGGLGIYWLQGPFALGGAVFVSTFGAFAALPAVGAQRNELFATRHRATAVVWFNNIGVLGSVAGLALGSLTIDRIGLSQTVSVLAVGMVIAAFLVLLLPETRGQPLGMVVTDR